jgi:hypothetical protein
MYVINFNQNMSIFYNTSALFSSKAMPFNLQVFSNDK